MATHHLAMPIEPYQAVLDGRKRSVTRLTSDAPFAVDDILVLQEASGDSFTGREAFVQVTYVETTLGMEPEELVIASLERRASTSGGRTSTQQMTAVPAAIVVDSPICACAHAEALHDPVGGCAICACPVYQSID